MQQRRSRPKLPSVFGDRGDRTEVSVSPAPTAAAPKMTAPNVIPFAKPRAIAALLDDKKVTPLFCNEVMRDAMPSTWGSAAKPAQKNLWASDLKTPPGAQPRIASGTQAPPMKHEISRSAQPQIVARPAQPQLVAQPHMVAQPQLVAQPQMAAQPQLVAQPQL